MHNEGYSKTMATTIFKIQESNSYCTWIRIVRLNCCFTSLCFFTSFLTLPYALHFNDISLKYFQPPEALDVMTMKSSWQDRRVEDARYNENRNRQCSLNSASTETAVPTVCVNTPEQKDRDLAHNMAPKTENGDIGSEEVRNVRIGARLSLDGRSTTVMMSSSKTANVEQTPGPPNRTPRTPTGATLETFKKLSDDRPAGTSGADDR